MNGDPLRILLVEDDMAHAEIAMRNLSKSRIANILTHVSDGQEALDYLFHHDKYTDAAKYPVPNIILLDLRLPKVDGLEVLEKIKSDPVLSAIPVVVLTTSSAESDVARAYTHHVSSYLVKPLDFEKFSDLIETFGYYWLAWNKYPY
jgi:CheY-like chemotaxis protein